MFNPLSPDLYLGYGTSTLSYFHVICILTMKGVAQMFNPLNPDLYLGYGTPNLSYFHVIFILTMKGVTLSSAQ